MSREIKLKIDSELYLALEKRAKKEFLEVDELVEDIVRRSMLSYHKGNVIGDGKVDDKLIGIFSRSKKGRKKRK
ncbi:MAG: hypothetical protein AABX35_00825 [Nanoarchaeota archaeon]